MAEACEVCGFVWADVPEANVPARLRAAAAAFADVLRESGDAAAARPDADCWSALEYGGHVRDVLFNLRDRIVLGAVEDNPVPNALHGGPRVVMGLYALDTPAVVADEIAVGADLLARTWECMTPELRARPIFYGWPVATTRTVSWVGSQAVHEVEHHLADAGAAVSGARAAW